MNASRKEAVRAVRAAMKDIDQDIVVARERLGDLRERLGDLRRDRAELERAEAALTRAAKPVARKRTGDHSIAGPKAIKAVDDLLLKRGRAYQAEITEATGLNSGTVTHALRALAKDGKIIATQNVRNRSREFAHVEARGPAKRRARKTPVAA